MNKARARRWQTAQDRARLAAELLEEAESLTPPVFLASAVTVPAAVQAAPPPSPSGRPWDRERELAEADRALAADAANPALLSRRAAVLAALGRFAAAQRDLLGVLEAQPDDREALVSLGTLLSRKGLWGEATVRLGRAVALDPALAPAWYHLGEALNHLDDLPGALAAYERAAALDPRNPKAFHGQGVVLDRMHRPADATVRYRRAREVAGR